MMKLHVYVLFFSILLFNQSAIAVDFNKTTDEKISERYSTLHLSVDAPDELRERVTACIVDAFQSIPYVSFVREYGYNPRVNSFAPSHALHVVASRIPNAAPNDQFIVLSILIHHPFPAEEYFEILNKSTTTGEPLFEKDVLLALTTATNNQTTIEKHLLVYGSLSNLRKLCKSLAFEFDSTVLEKQREVMRRLKKRQEMR